MNGALTSCYAQTSTPAGCAGFVDAAARRALPGHLLRRSRILSSIRIGPECLQRVAVTACSGEELVLSWRLRRAGPEAPSGAAAESSTAGSRSGGGGASGGSGAEEGTEGSSSGNEAATSSSSGSGGDSSSGSGSASVVTAWQLAGISRDASGDDDGLPTRPHPRVPPERAVLAMLAALRRGALHEAARFTVWGRHVSSATWEAQMQVGCGAEALCKMVILNTLKPQLVVVS